MKLIQKTISDVSDVKVTFYTAQLKSQIDDILVICFELHRDVNSRDLCFMDAMKIAGAKIWLSSAIILDFRELPYKWGDTMQCLFQSPYPKANSAIDKMLSGHEQHCPVMAVKSPLNEAGLISLVRSEMGGNPSAILFDSVEEAIHAAEISLLKVPKK